MNHLADQIGELVARKLFEKRGNHYEMHLCEAELATIISAACNLYSRAQPKVKQ